MIEKSQDSNGNSKPLLRKPRPPKLVPLPKIVKSPSLSSDGDEDYYKCLSQIEESYHDSEDNEEYLLDEAEDVLHPPTRQQSQVFHNESQKALTATIHTETPVRHAISKHDRCYILDPIYDSKSTSKVKRTRTSTTKQSSLVQPYRPRGPGALPPRVMKRANQNNMLHEYLLHTDMIDEDIRYFRPPLFTLNNFIINFSEREGMPIDSVKKIVLSSHNYKKIQELIAKQINPPIPIITHIDLDQEVKDSIPEVKPRIPSRQVLMEITSLIKEHLSHVAMTEVECKFRKLPKYDIHYPPDRAPHTEIVVYEKDRNVELQRYVQFEHTYEHPSRDALFSAGSRAFQDSERGYEPFASDDQISPAEVCILDSIMNGGVALSLKANFLRYLPELGSLVLTLTYVNLSYNTFSVIPKEIFLIKQLEVLKIRNNPLREISSEITNLQSLQTLIVSFCLLTEISDSIYSLKNLEVLDFSYNSIPNLDNKIRNLTHLKDLNLDGNELLYLPWPLLTLHSLKRLRVRHNFLHPLIWRDSARNTPQSLFHCAARILCRYQESRAQDEKLPLLDSFPGLKIGPERCDCCQKMIIGRSLKALRPCPKLVGVRMVPIVFDTCSPTCLSEMSGSDKIVELLLKGEVDLAIN